VGSPPEDWEIWVLRLLNPAGSQKGGGRNQKEKVGGERGGGEERQGSHSIEMGKDRGSVKILERKGVWKNQGWGKKLKG